MPLVKQELLTLMDHLTSNLDFIGISIIFRVFVFDFVHLLAMTLSSLLTEVFPLRGA